MAWLIGVLTSSIGKKIQVALAGLLLSLFLVAHLAGNFLMWGGPAYYDKYAGLLEANFLVPVAEAGLLALFVVHIFITVYLKYENWKARGPVGYKEDRWAGGRTISSATTIYTGLIILAFLAVHITTMKYGDHGPSLYAYVIRQLQSAPMAALYLAAFVALGLHLTHGVQAAARTLGVEHPRFVPMIERVGLAFAILIAASFAAIAVWAGWLATGVRP